MVSFIFNTNRHAQNETNQNVNFKMDKSIKRKAWVAICCAHKMYSKKADKKIRNIVVKFVERTTSVKYVMYLIY